MNRKVVVSSAVAAVLVGICCAFLAITFLPQLGEKEIVVSIEMDGVPTASYTVNSFNNAYISNPPQPPQGSRFAGWSQVKGWTEGVDLDTLLIEGKLIRYADIKDMAADGHITLFPAFREIHKGYFVLGWYSRTKTSGLDEDLVAPMEAALKEFFRQQGATEDELATVTVRGYDGDVAAMGAAVQKDGDVDILIGVGNNVDAKSGTSAGLTTFAKSRSLTINGKEGRRIALLTDTERSIQVYHWLQEYVKEHIDPSFEPREYAPSADTAIGSDNDPTVGKKLVLLWYGRTGTSGCTEEDMAQLDADLKGYLAESHGFAPEEVLVVKSTDGNMAALVDQVQELNRVDLILGTGNNIGSTPGKKSGAVLAVTDISDKFAINGVESRRLTVLGNDPAALDAYQWLLDYAEDHFGNTGKAESGTAELTAESVKGKKLVLVWYGRPRTSGCTEETMAELESALKEYLAGTHGIAAGDVLVAPSVDGNVAALVDQIQSVGKVDLVLGVGNNIKTTAGKSSGRTLDVVRISSGMTINGVTGRRLALLGSDPLSEDVYSWLQTYSKSHFANTKSKSGGSSGSSVRIPAEDPTGEKDLVVMWYGRTRTSGIQAADMTEMEKELKEYLAAAHNVDPERVLVYRSVDGNTTTFANHVRRLSRVDIILGTGSGIGDLLTVEQMSSAFSINGVTGRRMSLLNDDELAKDAYLWMLNYVKSHFGNVPEEDATGGKKLVLLWYGNSDTSGCTEEGMAALETALKDYLAGAYGITGDDVLVKRSTDVSTGALVDQIQDLQKVDLVLGTGNLRSVAGSTGEKLKVVANDGVFTVNGKENRRLSLLTDSEVAVDAYNWLQNYYIGSCIDPGFTPSPYLGTDAADPLNPAKVPTKGKELVLVWYGKTDTSGCEQEDMTQLEEDLKAYLNAAPDIGIDPERILVAKGTDGNVAALVSQIQKLNRADLVLGAGSNIGTTPGANGDLLDVTALSDGLTIRGKTGRRLALLGSDEGAGKVYDWLLEYAKTHFGNTEEPEPTDPTEGKKLVLIWYNRANTSGYTEEDQARLEADLKAYLPGVDGLDITADDIVILGSKDVNVAGLVDQVQGLARVDLILDVGNNIGTTQGTSGETLDVKALSDGFAINGIKDRKLARLTDDAPAAAAYDWLLEYAKTHFGNTEEPEPADPTEGKKLVLMWYGRTGTSGCGQEDMDEMEAALGDYLSAIYNMGSEEVLVLKSTDGNVGELAAEVKGLSRVDLLLGVGNNIDGNAYLGSAVKQKSDAFPINGVSDRRLARLTDDPIAQDVYSWVLGYAENHFGNTAQTNPLDPEEIKENIQKTDTPDGSEYLVVAWYRNNNSGKRTVSYLYDDVMEQVAKELLTHLSSMGATNDQLRRVKFRALDGNVAAVDGALADHDDLLIGGGPNNLQSTAADKKFAIPLTGHKDVTDENSTNRRAFLLNDDPIAKYVFEWIKGNPNIFFTDPAANSTITSDLPTEEAPLQPAAQAPEETTPEPSAAEDPSAEEPALEETIPAEGPAPEELPAPEGAVPALPEADSKDPDEEETTGEPSCENEPVKTAEEEGT